MFLSLFSTACTLLLTGYATYISNSVTLLADFLKCLVEFLAIAIAFVVVLKTRRLDKARYNYGFGKLEQLSSTAVAFAMFCSALLCVVSAIDRFVAPQPIQNFMFGLILAMLSVLGNGYMWRRFLRLAATSPSPVITSQTSLFLSKMLASLVVTISLSLSFLAPSFPPFLYADGFGSLAIALFLLYSGFTIASDSVEDLVDRSVDEAFQLIVYQHLVKYEDAYSGFHGIRSRRVGMHKMIQIFLTFQEDIPNGQIRTKLQLFQKDIEAEIPNSEVIIVWSLRDH